MPQIEVLQQANSTAAPGWAYVLDHAVDPSKTAIDPTGASRKKAGRAQRAAATSSVTNNELSRREAIAIQRRLNDLDKEGGAGKDVPIPAKWKDFAIGVEGGGVGTWGKGRKTTTAARRVLLSEKNFGHWLDDEEARLALTKDANAGALQGRRSDFGTKRSEKRASIAGKGRDEDVYMPDALDEDEASAEPSEALDADDSFFKVSVPTMLSSNELEDLLSHPPLSYNAARVRAPGASDPHQRRFCEMCGYWGRVMCLKCGSRVCGLACKSAHDMDCRRRFA